MAFAYPGSRVQRWTFAIGLWCGLVLTQPALAQPKKDQDPLSFDRNIGGLLSRYCYRCHNESDASGDIDLKKDENPRLIAKNAVVWRTALEKVASKEMPPEDAKQPSDEERELIEKFLQLTLGEVHCDGEIDPGDPLIRRLNRAEYDHSIRALTGLDLQIADSFAADASSYGFANIAASLTLTPLQVEQYYAAAQKVVAAILESKASDTPAGYRQVYVTNAERAGSNRAAAKEIMQRFAKLAFRRPVESDWVEQLMTVYDRSIAQEQSHDVGVGNMIAAVLISPRFLMRAEMPRPEVEGPFPIDDFDLASRLSFFLWSGPPDEILLDLAANGELTKPAVIDQQIQRMLADPRSASLIEQFFAAWLQFDNVSSHQPDAKVFPDFDAKLQQAIAAEPRLVIADMIRQDRPITDLIDADYTYANQTLASHYGLQNVDGEAMRRVALSDRRRGGVLTSAAVLMSQADPGRTNVPRRGNFVAGTILGVPAPPPPPDVPALKEPAATDKPLTLRERFEAHRSDAQCASCHVKIDPLGLALENYDAIGAWRETEVGRAIDATGVLPDGRQFDGPVALKDILLERKEDFAKVFAKQMLIYALGRGPVATDSCVIEDAVEAATQNEYRFSALVKSIVHSYPFLHRRNPEF
ncbi:MAG: DUF1592 domain-containing protein [Planctomycetaceae bacterium]